LFLEIRVGARVCTVSLRRKRLVAGAKTAGAMQNRGERSARRGGSALRGIESGLRGVGASRNRVGADVRRVGASVRGVGTFKFRL
jgi:hypothetical protein